MNILLDTNVVLDVLLQRTKWLEEASQIWAGCETGRLLVFVSSSSITDIYYIARKLVGAPQARKVIEDCVTVLQIMNVGRTHLEAALNRGGKDFEDDLQIILAQEHTLDAIVTRDAIGFADTSVPVLNPAELIARLNSTDQASPQIS